MLGRVGGVPWDSLLSFPIDWEAGLKCAQVIIVIMMMMIIIAIIIIVDFFAGGTRGGYADAALKVNTDNFKNSNTDNFKISNTDNFETQFMRPVENQCNDI